MDQSQNPEVIHPDILNFIYFHEIDCTMDYEAFDFWLTIIDENVHDEEGMLAHLNSELSLREKKRLARAYAQYMWMRYGITPEIIYYHKAILL